MDELEALLAETDGLAEVLHRVLDRREKARRMPQSMTIDAGPELERALRTLLGSAALRRTEGGRLRLRLRRASRTGEALAEVLYRALRRSPADRDATSRERARALDEGLLALRPSTPTARGYVETERAVLRAERAVPSDDAPSLWQLAERDGVELALREADRVVRVIDALVSNDQLLRLPAFATAALGRSKGLRWGDDTFRRAGAAVADHHRAIRAEVQHALLPRARVPAFVFEALGVYRDSAAASVLLFGPLVYRKRGLEFRQALQHARLGEPVRLTTAQLRGAEVDAVERVWLVENLTPFLDLVDVLTRPSTTEVAAGLLVHTGGQANWAVVTLLRGLARHGVPMLHAGDLDRSGVHILRSLRRRTGARIAPWHMDAATHARYRDCGLPLGEAERRRVGRARASSAPGEPGAELLDAIAASGVWIEQEAFSDETLVPDLRAYGA